MKHIRQISIGLILALPVLGHAAPEWGGGSVSSNNWSDSTNWLWFDRPNSGDSVWFTGTPARTSPYVNQDYSVDTLHFDELSTFGTTSSFTINGSGTLSLIDGVRNKTSRSQTVNVHLKFDTNGKLSNNSGNGDYGWLGINTVDTNGKTVTLQPSSNNISMSGAISGSGRIVVDGPGQATFSASNSWSGGLEIQRGTVNYGSGPNLGAVGNWIDFNAYGGYTPTLRRYGNGTTSGPMNFVNGEGRIAIASGVSVTHSGDIFGAGDLAKTEGGNLVLSGPSSRTGKTYVREGTLQLEGSATLPDNLLEVSTGATLAYLGAVDDRVGSLSGLGTINLRSDGAWGVGNPGNSTAAGNGSGTFGGSINGSNIVVNKQGSGTLNLTGSNTFSGSLDVIEGKLLFNNTGATSASGTADSFVHAGATLGGDGSTNGSIDVYEGGTVEPSSSIVPGVGIGSLKAGIVALRPGSTMKAEISSGGGNDVLNSATTAFIDRSTLVLSTTLGLPVNTATTRTILHADGGLTGTFGTITGMTMSNGKVLAVTYGANDVFVTAATPGDADLNGIVNFDDLLTLAQNYSADTTGRIWSKADFNGNTITDFDDLLALAQHYGSGALTGDQVGLLEATFAADWAMAQSLVPEPTALALLGMASAAFRRRR
jgi:autotransporter-associated beta strand protein